jgi:hypothetical protein
VVPDGTVTSVYRAAGATGLDVAAEIGALVVAPPAAAVSVAVVFSGGFAPLHAANPKANPNTQAHFVIENLHVIRIASRHDWKPTTNGPQKGPNSVIRISALAKSLPLSFLIALMMRKFVFALGSGLRGHPRRRPAAPTKRHADHYTLWFAPDLQNATFRGRETIDINVGIRRPSVTSTLPKFNSAP